MDSRRGPALALLVAVLAFPASSQAAVRCVPASGPGCASSHATIAGAVGTREPTADQLDVGRAAVAEILRVEAASA
ncbi:MAG TPA: hypothetical protein VHR40_09835 [Thermoleophilaceae bacterium]|nr:hypothetical protein [Thermoleophilaceae bacterium]